MTMMAIHSMSTATADVAPSRSTTLTYPLIRGSKSDKTAARKKQRKALTMSVMRCPGVRMYRRATPKNRYGALRRMRLSKTIFFSRG